MKSYIGIDLGGTNVRVGKVNEDGQILQMVSALSYANQSAEIITQNIINLIKQINYQDCLAIGLAAPGSVDDKKNIVRNAANIPAINKYPLAQKINEATNLEVYLGNDANLAGLAESCCGAGRGYENVFYITHSTGIGGAIIINQKLVTGRKGSAGEIGSLLVRSDSYTHNGHTHNSLEQVAAGPAIEKQGKELLNLSSTKAVFDLASQGNKTAVNIIEQMAKDMAMMMYNVTNILDPDCYVVGGGVSKSFDLYIPKVREYLACYLGEKNLDVPIKKAILTEPGVIGAAMLAKVKY